MDFLTGNSILLSQRGLDFLWKKQAATLDNIANDDTPNYKAKYVTFEEELRLKLNSVETGGTKSSFREQIINSKIKTKVSDNESSRADGNNVNVDVESTELVRTAIQYQYMLSSINSDFTRLRTAIKGQ